MKKILFLLPVAAVALTACTNESTEYIGTPEAREISFSPLTQNVTRAAIADGVFPTSSKMQVAAFDVTNNRDFFDATEFSYKGTDDAAGGSKPIWTAGKYWPLSPATINFLAYAEFNGTTATWGSSHKASEVTLEMEDNSSAPQKDLIYACGTGTVSQSSNTLTFPENVPMEFKHAQAWVCFTVKAKDATTSGKVTVNSITLNGAKYEGSYKVTHTNYNATSGQSVAGAWTTTAATKNVVVPSWTAAAATTTEATVGDGLLVVPGTGAIASFTISYKVDGKDYDYTYTPDSKNLEEGKKYTYNIVFNLHEIEIAATVKTWEDATGIDAIEIQ